MNTASEGSPAFVPRHIARQRVWVLGAGISSLIVTLGIGRFAYTPLLPVMLAETSMTYAEGAWLTSVIYLGYLGGAMGASLAKSLIFKERLYRAGLIGAVISTAGMGLTENVWIWAFWRFWAGMSGAAGLILASALIMHWLIRHDLRKELGLHFAGVGIGIIFVSLAVEAMILTDMASWRGQWYWLTIVGGLLAIPAWRWMPTPDPSGQTVSGVVVEDRPPAKGFLRLFFVAYMFAGVGYVVSATFTVDIIKDLPGMASYGNVAFMLVGLGAMPAAVVWDRFSRTWGYLTCVTIAFALHIPAVLIPVLLPYTLPVFFSTMLFGFCFLGGVSMVLTMAGLYYPTHPAKLMGRLTMGYCIAQILAPIFIGWFATDRGGYDHGLLLAAAFMIVGTLLMLWLRVLGRDAI